MTRAYPGIQGTGIFENLAIEHLSKGLTDWKIAYGILTKKPRTLSETVDMITWHEACRQQTVKNSGVRKTENMTAVLNMIQMTENYRLITYAELIERR